MSKPVLNESLSSPGTKTPTLPTHTPHHQFDHELRRRETEPEFGEVLWFKEAVVDLLGLIEAVPGHVGGQPHIRIPKPLQQQ